ncbi:aldo/keto reductase [Actinopolymorpha pittospori]|uniref:Aryl-alcohol dehydrogenase-like predicted oxidoreductase n=1 Tax=Actinopolymorpha pittospori TaxID=648752 RepID=A0A927R8W3_9ACTN|nr:aldo/keto reductase [Actinopolymorpha pittospori]MBE1607172.1 aryl-alcohol dehydrogenase-like predicted oxidoreductase [Actinopolymorpha pittospori]
MRRTVLGRTGLEVSRIALGGYPFGGVNRANGWDPWSEDGRRTAIATINRALDLGITYIDTAPSYGAGNSEALIGQVMQTRRDECVLATKVGWSGMDKQAVIDSVYESLKRLRTDHLDLVQFHGGMYTAQEYHHIVDGGPLDGLRRLKEQGDIAFIGLTAEEPWTARQFLDVPDIDVVQLAYNLIYQAAARHVLEDARAANVGVVTMRTMTSGIFQRAARHLAPTWQDAADLYEVCLKFVLSDSRVHTAIVGMRWPEEVERNVALVDGFDPDFDLAELPRMTAHVYQAEDADLPT